MIDKNEIIVLDDVVSPAFQDLIHDWLIAGDNAWYFSKDVAFADDVIQRGGYEKKYAFSKTFFSITSGVQTPMFSTILPLILEGCHKINFKLEQTLFSRSFFTMPLPNSGPDDFDHTHVDVIEPHLVCLYYVNDSDGDTVFFDRTLDEFLEEPAIKAEMEHLDYADPRAPGPLEIIDRHIDKSKFNIIKRVTPKKGRMVFFNGYRYHSAARPSSGYRVVINSDLRGYGN